MIKKDPCSIVRKAVSSLNLETRKDYRGTIIKKGSKDHKVAFIDNISKIHLKEEVLVENYKEYNTDMSYGNDKCECRCNII